MALGDQAGLAAVQAAVAQIPGLEAFLGGKVNDLHAALAQTLTDGISQVGETEKQVIDYGLQKAVVLLNSQRAALVSDIDRRFMALGAILEALGLAIQKNAALTPDTSNPPASA